MVFIVDRKKELKQCKLCNIEYNLNKQLPECLIPCGHTFCKCCLNKLKSINKCPSCKLVYNQIITDYEMIDMMLKNKSNDSNNEQKQFEENKDNLDNNNNNVLRPEIIHLINEGTKSQQLIGVIEVRKLLSKESNPPIDEIIEANLIPKLTEFLVSNDEKLQFESAWALTNIASGNSMQTKCVVDAGCIPLFVNLLNTNNNNNNNNDVQEQSIWALGNIAGDSANYRDMIINNGILPPLLDILKNKSKPISLLKNSAWCLSNLYRGKPGVNIEYIKLSLPVINYLINEYYKNQDDFLTDVLWCLSYMSDGSNDLIQIVLDNIDLNKIVELLMHNNTNILTPSLRIIGNIVTGDDEQTQQILNLNVLSHFQKLLNNPKQSIIKEVCWIISNITAGTKGQIQAVIDSNLFQQLVILLKSTNTKIVKETIWAISNSFSGGSKEHYKYLIDLKILNILCQIIIDSTDNATMDVSLETLNNFLSNFLEYNFDSNIFKIFEECNLIDKLEYFEESSKNSNIIEKSTKLLSTLSQIEEELDNRDLII